MKRRRPGLWVMAASCGIMAAIIREWYGDCAEERHGG